MIHHDPSDKLAGEVLSKMQRQCFGLLYSLDNEGNEETETPPPSSQPTLPKTMDRPFSGPKPAPELGPKSAAEKFHRTQLRPFKHDKPSINGTKRVEAGAECEAEFKGLGPKGPSTTPT